MNKDTIKGKTNQVVGEARERTGRAVGNDELEAKGLVQATKGQAQSAVGTFKDQAGSLKGKAVDLKDKLKSAAKG